VIEQLQRAKLSASEAVAALEALKMFCVPTVRASACNAVEIIGPAIPSSSPI